MTTLDEFYTLMIHTKYIRKQIVERVLSGTPMRAHFQVSLKNALVRFFCRDGVVHKVSFQQSLLDSCEQHDLSLDNTNVQELSNELSVDGCNGTHFPA